MLVKVNYNLERLWNDIRLIYEGFNFSSKQLIDDLMIISQDNHYSINSSNSYLLQYKKDLEPVVNIRIEKNYNLTNIIGNNGNTTSYNIIVQVGNNGYKHEDQMVDFTYTIITPFLREAKLNKIGL
jgi:hypothetical protein